MKILDHKNLVILNESSIRAGLKHNLQPERIPNHPDGRYIVNFCFDHEFNGMPDVRMSVILKTGEPTAWLDISPEKYESITDIELSNSLEQNQ